MKKYLGTLMLCLFSFLVIGCDSTLTATGTNPTVPKTTTTTVETTTTTTTTGTTTTTATTTTVPTTTVAPQTIEFYAINDLHGTAYSDLATLSKIGGFLHAANESNPNTVILASGDMFQGTAFSNYYYGLPLVEVMNYAGFDAFTLGNHEFDWGIDKIAAYNDDSETNGEADFSILAANIVSKTTGEPMPWTVPYVIVETNGLHIGIIGVIGDVINSISASRVSEYEFLDAAPTVADYAYELRTAQDCDIILVSIHEYDAQTNAEIAALTGNCRVDALFNGHTHGSMADTIVRPGADLPYAQVSGYSSSLIAKITLVFDPNSGAVTFVDAEVLGIEDLGSTDSFVDSIIARFGEETEYVSFISQVLATTASPINRFDDSVAIWGASVLRDYAGVDFGMLNAGGFRVNLGAGNITMGDLVEFYPFDNYIKTCYLSGEQLTQFYEYIQSHGSDVVFDDGVAYVDGVLSKDGIAVEPDALYSVGAVDYVFDKTSYVFLDGIGIVTTAYLMRNLLADDLLATVGNFDPAEGTSHPDPS